MHVVQARNLIGQVVLGEIVPESPVELFVALPPVDEGLSNVLTGHLDLCVPLVARGATSIPMFIAGCVRGTALFNHSCRCRLFCAIR